MPVKAHRASGYLRSPEDAAAYLSAALEEMGNDPRLFMKALRNVAEAQGFTLRGSTEERRGPCRSEETGGVPMTAIKISSKVDEAAWNELRDLARKTKQDVSGVLSEAIEEYLARRRGRPEALQHLDDSMRENEELGKLLAK